MDNRWNYFQGIPDVVLPTVVAIPVIILPKVDYRAIAKCRESAIAEITKDPSILKKVVDRVEDEYMGFYNHNYTDVYGDYTDVYFFDLLIEYKSVTESDLIAIDGIDWIWLVDRVPLSTFAINKFLMSKEKEAWLKISNSHFYKKTYEFITTFAHMLEFDIMGKSQFNLLTVDEIVKLVLVDKIISTSRCIHLELLKCRDQEVHFQCVDVSGINAYPQQFYKQCLQEVYVPQTPKFIELIQSNSTTDWAVFIMTCKPSEQFIEKHILNQHNVPYISISISSHVWDILSGAPSAYKDNYYRSNYRFKASPAFIAKYMDKLTFKYLVHHFQFDMETLAKHLTLDNATIISSNQQLTEQFIKDHADILDWYELVKSHSLDASNASNAFEDFVRCHCCHLNTKCWKYIYKNYKYSPEFAEEFRSKLLLF